jgi:hypothetical protein
MPSDLPEEMCNFCGHSKDETATLIAGPKVFICDVCVIYALGVLCRETRGLRFRLDYFAFESILKAGYAIEWLLHGGRIPDQPAAP